MQAGTAALLTCACPRGQPHAAGPCGCSTHVAEEAELVVLPAKAPVIRSWGATLLAPAKAAEPLSSTLPAPARAARPRSPIAHQAGGRSPGCSTPEPNVGPKPTTPWPCNKVDPLPSPHVMTTGRQELPTAQVQLLVHRSAAERGAWPKNAHPDSNPGRGSLKVVVRVLWSTK